MTHLYTNKRSFAFILFLFLLSGFSALLYQVIWQRMLAMFSGVDIYSVTIIVAAFMGGLGFGSMVGGYISDRISGRWRILLFALSEFFIGAFALISKYIYYDFLYLNHNHLASSGVVMTLVLFLSLLIPTFLMGMTLPLLSKALIGPLEKAAETIGALYGLNTLGAALGAFITGWVLIRSFGFVTTLHIGAAINFFCAFGALLVLGYSKSVPENEEMDYLYDSELTEYADTSSFSFPAWAAIYALSGFLALALEIIWFRLVGVMLRSTPFTFSTLLSIFLGGLGLGTILGIYLAKRSRNPGRLFFLFQGGITLYAAVSITVFIYLLGDTGPLKGIWDQFSIFRPLDFSGLFSAASGATANFDRGALFNKIISMYFVIPIILIGPPTILMGLSFSFLQKTVHNNRAYLGRRVGWLQTSNILGSMAGAFFIGWLVLNLFGTSNSIKILTLLGGIYLIFFMRVALRKSVAYRWLGYAASVLLIFVVIAIFPASKTLWSKLHASSPDVVTFSEDGTGITLIKSKAPGSFESKIIVNGSRHSWLPYNSTSNVHSFLGLLPAMLHPNPKDVVLIGFGSGETLFAVSGRTSIENITSIELMSHQYDLLERFNRPHQYRGLLLLQKDKRIKYLFGDGRAFLNQNEKKYDIIEADPMHHTSAYSGNLYSLEYFKLMRKRLKPGGYAVTWSPTGRTLYTFIKAFPYAVLLHGVLIGSSDPIEYDEDIIRKRLSDPAIKEHYRVSGLDHKEIEEMIFGELPYTWGPDYDRASIVDFNSDLYPKDEYLVPGSN